MKISYLIIRSKNTLRIENDTGAVSCAHQSFGAWSCQHDWKVKMQPCFTIHRHELWLLKVSNREFCVGLVGGFQKRCPSTCHPLSINKAVALNLSLPASTRPRERQVQASIDGWTLWRNQEYKNGQSWEFRAAQGGGPFVMEQSRDPEQGEKRLGRCHVVGPWKTVWPPPDSFTSFETFPQSVICSSHCCGACSKTGNSFSGLDSVASLSRHFCFSFCGAWASCWVFFVVCRAGRQFWG